MRTAPGVPREVSRLGQEIDHVTPFAQRRYSVDLWDYNPSGEEWLDDGEWSGDLARAHLGGPNEGLTWREIGQAIKKLLAAAWSYETMYVTRDDKGRKRTGETPMTA